MSDVNVIITSECEECRYGEVIEQSKRDIWVKCKVHDKLYRYGQCIQCEDKEKRNGRN